MGAGTSYIQHIFPAFSFSSWIPFFLDFPVAICSFVSYTGSKNEMKIICFGGMSDLPGGGWGEMVVGNCS